MSKIGQRKINIPSEVKVTHEGDIIKAVGPKGELQLKLGRHIEFIQTENVIEVKRNKEDKATKSMHGLMRKLIENMVVGVSQGFEKKLDFKGVGFRAEANNGKLILNVGFSHPVELVAPEGVEIKVEKNVITVSGIDRQKVGQVAANIRAIKPVEPYKGKGIKYIDEIPRRKQGKAAKAAVGGGA